jgi:phenylacetate-CoA ligase
MSALRELLEIAARHRWYQAANGGNRLADWPILTKTDLYARLASARQEPGGRAGVYYSRSGGTTTGQPLYFPTDVAENHEQRQRLARRLAADGVLSPETVAVNICPIVRMYRAMEIFNEFCECCGATVLPMAAIAGDEEIYEQAMLFAANTLIGMPSRLVAFARHVQEKRLTWQVDGVVFGGEFLQPGKRRFLREVLGVKRFSGVYGSAELGVVAWHPDLPAVPVYHFPRDVLHVEIVAPDADGYGALVATNLVRRRFPIVRYNTGDVGRVVAEGAETVSVELRGRQSDSFLIGDNYHTLADFADLFQELAEFQIQIRFDETLRKDVIRFCLNAGDRVVPEAERRALTGRIQDRLEGHEVMYHTEVAFVGPDGLIRSRDNLKTPAIVDRRGR